MAKSISVLPEQEQQYLTITGKTSIALAFFFVSRAAFNSNQQNRFSYIFASEFNFICEFYLFSCVRH